MPPVASQDVITGGWAARIAESGGASQMGFGDSIWYTPQSWSMWGRFAYSCAAAGILCNGAVTGIINSAGAGWPVQTGQWGTGGGTLTATSVRPGASVPADSTNGNNMRLTEFVAFTGNYTNFGTPISMVCNTIGGVTWDQSKNVQLIAVARSTTSPRGPALWRLQVINRSNAQVGADITVNLNQTAALRNWASGSSARGTGATTTVGRFSAWNEDETGWQAQFLSWGCKVVSPASGVFWAYAGHGSWTPKNHAYSTGQSITADPPTYTGRWSDDALTAEILAYKLDTFFWRCGNNPSADGVGAYATELAAWRARVVACHAAAQAIDPTIKSARFVIVSPYASDGTESYWDTIRTANRAMALANLSDTEHLDECGFVYDTYGSYSTYSGTQTVDGTHPATTLRDACADFYRTKLLGGVVGVPGGTGITPGIPIGVHIGV